MVTSPTDTSHKRRLLLVEDDPALALGIRDTMEFEGFSVIHTSTGKSALSMLESAPPDIVILDLMLPDINGFEICERIRSQAPQLPVIMLTARSQETDKVRAFDAGADDYVTKPFSVAELVARVHALLRRSQVPAPSQSFALGKAVVHPRTHQLECDGTMLHLSHHEMGVLVTLEAAQGSPVSREELLKRVWKSEQPSPRTIDNIVVKLRKLVENDASEPNAIVTVYGLGYKLQRPER